MSGFDCIETGGAPIKAWTRGVPIEDAARRQIENVARLPFIHKHVAIMPDVHWGMGATVGSVIPTVGAIIPAAVGVDIGCGMAAVRTTVAASRLPDSLAALRTAIEAAVPHGRTDHGGRNDRGAWTGDPPAAVAAGWDRLKEGYAQILEQHPKAGHQRALGHLGTLGTGNHFVELCLDEEDRLWVMLHSGSRGVGNKLGSYFIALAKKEMRRWFVNLPDEDLAYLPEGTEHFAAYLRAVGWAQRYARLNRELMMEAVLDVVRRSFPRLWQRTRRRSTAITTTSSRSGISERMSGSPARVRSAPAPESSASFRDRWEPSPLSCAARATPNSFETCSHGAGRAMSRNEAKRRFTLEDHARATAHVECRKDEGVIDETPGAYKDIDAVMAAQADLVEIVHTLRQVVCVKG